MAKHNNFFGINFSDSLKLLQYLSISYLPDTTRIGSGALNVFANLSTLVATDNPNLVSIDKYALAKNTSSPLYFDYPPLKELYLNNNNLRVFEREWIERWDKVTTIDFRYNPWTCVCTNSFLINTLMQQINSTCPMLAPEVKCATPEAWKGKKLLSLIGDNKDFVCEKSASEPAAKHGLTLISILLGVIVGVSLTLGAVMLYRRGCFGIRNRINPGYNAPGYNRANFAEDFHI